MIKAPPVFYIIHFDEFLISHTYFFQANKMENIERTGEIQFIKNIRLFQEYGLERGFLVNLRGEEKKNPINILGIGEDYLFSPEKEIFTIYDDLYRDSSILNNPLEEGILNFRKEYEENTGFDLSDATHYFAGYTSNDCVPSVIQALSSGKGISARNLDGYITIFYSGKKIPLGNIFILKECVWPMTAHITFNGEISPKPRIKSISLEELSST